MIKTEADGITTVASRADIQNFFGKKHPNVDSLGKKNPGETTDSCDHKYSLGLGCVFSCRVVLLKILSQEMQILNAKSHSKAW